MLFLNIYPVYVSRDMVFATKRGALQSQGSVISSSLSALEPLSEQGVEQVMALLDMAPPTRLVVTDADQHILYDADRTRSGGPLWGVEEALKGYAQFSCAYSYTAGAFTSRCTVPVVGPAGVTGAVYLYEYDTEQGDIIAGLQQNLGSMSVLFGGAGLVIIVVISTTLTRRIKRLSRAMDVVRGGDYSQRVPVRGRDELAALAEEFNVLTGRLEDTEEVRRRFVSDASHELRTPLAAIRLLSDSITQSDSMDPDTMREFARDIGAEAHRLQRITEKLMTLTKLDAGPAVRQPEPVDVKAVAERTLHLLEPLAAEQGVHLQTDLADGCVVSASADDLYQIIFNLAENGIKYNQPGGSVTLALRREDGQALLTVADTGIGIPEADMDHIFDRFYRVDKARSRASGGSGLGLAIVHDAVLANAGTIHAAAQSPAGTRFTVAFPLWDPQADRPDISCDKER